MVNIKKLEEKEVVFLNKPLTLEEEKEFSAFLKKRKGKLKGNLPVRPTIAKKQLA